MAIDETDADADVDAEDQSAKLKKILFEKKVKIKRLESKVVDLTADHEIIAG